MGILELSVKIMVGEEGGHLDGRLQLPISVLALVRLRGEAGAGQQTKDPE